MRPFLIALLSIFVISCSTGQNKQKLSAKEFSDIIEKTEGLQVLDVRTEDEFLVDHIKGAININFNDSKFIDLANKQLKKDETVYIYCLSGGRSSKAADKLRSAGYEVIEFPGGMMEWRSENLPVVQGKEVRSMSLEDYNKLLASDKLVLIDFYADWCIPCKKMEPYLKKIAEDSQDKVTIIRINADENPELCKALKVSGLPVLKLYKNTEVVWDHLGLVSEQVIREKIAAFN